MTRCTPKPGPSTTDLGNAPKRIKPSRKVGLFADDASDPFDLAFPPSETVAVEKLRIKLRTWFGRFHLEREIHKRLRR
jgi:hypothetical protein